MGEQAITWDYTTWLNIAALVLTLALLARFFFGTGGREMLAMMGGAPDDMAGHDHNGHDHAGRNRAGRNRAGHDRAGQEQAGRERAD